MTSPKHTPSDSATAHPYRQSDQACQSAGDSHIGTVRTVNQDVLLLEPGLRLYAVLDGMGGHKAGEVAARLAGDVIRDFVQSHTELLPRELLEAAIKEASAAVFGDAMLYHEHHGMGTTVVACLMVDGQHAVIAHVGDSRAYLCRDGQLQPMTRDHTVVQTLVDQGQLSTTAAATHPYKNVLSRSLGSKTETQVDCVELELEPGDQLLLCSDGLHGYATVEAIQAMLESDKTPERVVHDLIELALRGGGGDNVTALVIKTVPLHEHIPPTATVADSAEAINREHVALAAMSVDDARNMLLSGGAAGRVRIDAINGACLCGLSFREAATAVDHVLMHDIKP